MPTKSLKHAKVVLKGRRFNVVRTPGPRPREIVVHPGAVVILPLLDAKTVVMIRNERIAAGGELWELPAGTLEPKENPAHCAARELIEETGYRARRVSKLVEFYSSPGICTELMHCYVATGLSQVGQDLDEGEEIDVEVMPLKRAIRMVRENKIRDGKTIATLLYHEAFEKRRG